MTPKEVRLRRLLLGLGVDELARELRLSPSVLQEIERGDRPITEPALFEQTFARMERKQRREDDS